VKKRCLLARKIIHGKQISLSPGISFLRKINRSRELLFSCGVSTYINVVMPQEK
jgi:hypothetical protein